MISGGRVADTFRSGELDPWGNRSSGYGRKRGIDGNLPAIAVAVCRLRIDTPRSNMMAASAQKETAAPLLSSPYNL